MRVRQGLTPTGRAALAAGIVLATAGLVLHWPAFELLGIGVLVLVVLGVASVLGPSGLEVDRAVQPPRVQKGSPAIAVLTFANRGRRTVGVTVAHQPFGTTRVRTVLPRLRRGERGLRTYRLPTSQRGIVDVAPVEVTRRDPLDLFRRTRLHGAPERIWVQPRLLPLRPLPTGRTRHLEGPSSDTSPDGTVTFHRLRDYVVGDDLRLVHWRSTARTGRLVVRHNVDTSQPFTVVVLDVRPDRYTGQAFEEAVDMAASVLVTGAADKAPVELRQSDGAVLGGARMRDVTPLIDHLTAVAPVADGGLSRPLLALRRARGGTSLVVVTGTIDPADLPYVAALRRRFERLVVVSLDPAAGEPTPVAGVRVVVAADADEACAAWNRVATGAPAALTMLTTG